MDSGSGTESLVTARGRQGGLPSSSPCSWVAAGLRVVAGGCAVLCVIWVSWRRVLVGTGLRAAVWEGGQVSCREGRKRRVPKGQAVHVRGHGCGRVWPAAHRWMWGPQGSERWVGRGAGTSPGREGRAPAGVLGTIWVGALGKEALGSLGTARLQGLKMGCAEGWEESGSAVHSPRGRKAGSPWP